MYAIRSYYAPIWKSATDTLASNPNRPIVVDASKLEYVDDVGIARNNFV